MQPVAAGKRGIVEDLRCYTMHYYFEIKDAEIYGGVGSIGYSEITMDKAVNTETFIKEYFEESANNLRQGLAKQLNVPVENVTSIHRDVYEENAAANDEYDDSDSFADWEKG